MQAAICCAIAGTMGALAIINSIILAWRHLRRNRHTALRTYTLRILLIVPVFVVSSCTALLAHAPPAAGIYLKVLRELYESIVIFSFLQFILVCSGGPKALIARFSSGGTEQNKSVDQEVAPDQDIVISMTVQNMDTASLCSDPILLTKFNEAVRQAFTMAGDGPAINEHMKLAISANIITIHLGSADSVEGGESPEHALCRAGFSKALTGLVANMTGIESVSQGPISFSDAENNSTSASSSSTGTEKPVFRELKHVPALNCILPAWRSASQMLYWCVAGTLLYVLVGVGSAFATLGIFVVSHVDMSHDQAYQFTHKVCMVGLSISQATAIFCLAELALNMMEELDGLRPYCKFLSVKLIIFATFWQGLGLSALKAAGFFSRFAHDGWTEEHVYHLYANTLLAVEMFGFSMWHFWVFPPEDSYKVLARLSMAREADPKDEVPGNFKRENSLDDLPPTGSGQLLATVVDVRDIHRTACLVYDVRREAMSLPVTYQGNLRWHSQRGPLREVRTWSGPLCAVAASTEGGEFARTASCQTSPGQVCADGGPMQRSSSLPALRWQGCGASLPEQAEDEEGEADSSTVSHV